MKKYFIPFFLIAFLWMTSCASVSRKHLSRIIPQSIHTAVEQAYAMAESLREDTILLPKSIDENGNLLTSDSRWWGSGFFPGSLWYLYELTGEDSLRVLAESFTRRIEREKFTTNNHDVGFMIYCSFGNGYRLTRNTSYPEVMLTAARSLSTRYNPQIGLIRSWDFNKQRWQYPVIIDNMMNLELLMWATRYSRDSSFYKIAVSHADKTAENHYRPDNSCYHVVSYDLKTGRPEKKETWQGYSHESSWARGQAWGLYGYTMMYRETGLERYLNQAKAIADFLIHHPNLPEDKIPYWDFDAPDIPDAKRDASAAAIMASALIELSGFVDKNLKKEYLSIAEQQLITLSSPAYRATIGTNGNFLLKHCVGALPLKSEVDVPLTYADYYYLEALARYKRFVLEQ